MATKLEIQEMSREAQQKALLTIKEKMNESDIQQKVVQKLTGYDQGTLSDLLNGKRPRPSFEIIVRLMLALNITSFDFT